MEEERWITEKELEVKVVQGHNEEQEFLKKNPNFTKKGSLGVALNVDPGIILPGQVRRGHIHYDNKIWANVIFVK